MKVVAPPTDFRGTPVLLSRDDEGRITDWHAPHLGEHTVEVLSKELVKYEV
jgi:hypothetical protein